MAGIDRDEPTFRALRGYPWSISGELLDFCVARCMLLAAGGEPPLRPARKADKKLVYAAVADRRRLSAAVEPQTGEARDGDLLDVLDAHAAAAAAAKGGPAVAAAAVDQSDGLTIAEGLCSWEVPDLSAEDAFASPTVGPGCRGSPPLNPIQPAMLNS